MIGGKQPLKRKIIIFYFVDITANKFKNLGKMGNLSKFIKTKLLSNKAETDNFPQKQ